METIKIIDLDNLHLYDEEIKRYILKKVGDAVEEIIVCAESYLKFPTIGDSSSLYIDTTSNKTYRWDDNSLKYFIVGSDYDDIEIIDGTGK